jgi:hypothetical protein
MGQGFRTQIATVCSNADLIGFAPQQVVNDDGSAIREGLDRMARITWHDRDQAGSYDLGCAIDGHLKRALDHLVDLFLRMEVLMNEMSHA